MATFRFDNPDVTLRRRLLHLLGAGLAIGVRNGAEAVYDLTAQRSTAGVSQDTFRGEIVRPAPRL